MTGKRSDLRPQAVPSLYPWTKRTESNDEREKRSERREEAKGADVYSKKRSLVDGVEFLEVNGVKTK